MDKTLETTTCNLYEFSLLRKITGNTLRPGGLRLTTHALELCGLQAGAKILDVGCGVGASLAFFAKQGCVSMGVDISHKLLIEAQAHGLALMADAQALPVASSVFDAVFCECVVSLLPCPEQAFAEMVRVLRPDGWLVVSDIILPQAGEHSATPANISGESYPTKLPHCPQQIYDASTCQLAQKEGQAGRLCSPEKRNCAQRGEECREANCSSSFLENKQGQDNVSPYKVSTCVRETQGARRTPLNKAVVHGMSGQTVSDGKADELQKSVGTPPSSTWENKGRYLTPEVPHSCLHGAKTRAQMQGLFMDAGCTLHHLIDYKGVLREMAAKMVWEFGSMDAFWELWQGSSSETPFAPPCGRRFGYELFVGQKRT